MKKPLSLEVAAGSYYNRSIRSIKTSWQKLQFFILLNIKLLVPIQNDALFSRIKCTYIYVNIYISLMQALTLKLYYAATYLVWYVPFHILKEMKFLLLSNFTLGRPIYQRVQASCVEKFQQPSFLYVRGCYLILLGVFKQFI